MKAPAGDNRQWFVIFAWGEGGILLIAGLLAWWLDLDPFDGGKPDWRDGVGGVAASVPMVCLLLWIRSQREGAFGELNQLMKDMVAPMFRHWTFLQCLLVSVLAGAGEELLFRTVIQGGLSDGMGVAGAMMVSAGVFALLHWLTPAYALVAACMGLWLGWVWWLSGQLLVPVLAHALYDLIALRMPWDPGDSSASGE